MSAADTAQAHGGHRPTAASPQTRQACPYPGRPAETTQRSGSGPWGNGKVCGTPAGIRPRRCHSAAAGHPSNLTAHAVATGRSARPRKRLTMERPADSGRKQPQVHGSAAPVRAGRRHRTPVRNACNCGHGSHQGSLGSWPCSASNGRSIRRSFRLVTTSSSLLRPGRIGGLRRPSSAGGSQTGSQPGPFGAHVRLAVAISWQGRRSSHSSHRSSFTPFGSRASPRCSAGSHGDAGGRRP